MTPKMRQRIRDFLEGTCREHLKEDRWGNFVAPNGRYRIKFKKVNVRVERKMGKKWYGVSSYVWSKLNIEDMEKIINSTILLDNKL